MLPALTAAYAAKPLVKLGVWLIAAVLLALAVWWVAILPRQQLSAERAENTAYREKMVRLTAAAAEKARAAQTAIDTSLKEYSRETDFSAERTRIAMADAALAAQRRLDDLRAAGAAGVQNAWRQCLARPADGNGTGVAEGSAPLSDDGAAALGPVLAIGRRADLQYARAIEELDLTRGLLATCYGKPATP